MTNLGVLILLLLLPFGRAFFIPCAKRAAARAINPLGPVASNGLAFEDIEVGDGEPVNDGDYVSVHYVGKFTAPDGNEEVIFENSRQGRANRGTVGSYGEPLSFPIGQGKVIKGWDLGILGFDDEIPPMNVGGKRTLTIPANLAYGAEARGPIPANQDLVFDVELISIDAKDSKIIKQLWIGSIGIALAVLVGNTAYLTITGQE